MKNVRSRYLCAFTAVTDLVMLGGGIPLQRYSWSLLHHPQQHATLLLAVLGANLALLLLAVCAFLAATLLAGRGAGYAAKRVSTFFARPNPAARTNIPR